MAVPEEIMKKIQKILARADTSRGATESEAQTAMAMVQKMLAEHKLEMSDVRSYKDRSHHGFIQQSGKMKNIFWHADLMTVLATHMFCRSFMFQGQRGRFLIIGKPEDIAATLAAYKRFVVDIEHLAYEEYKHPSFARYKGETWKPAFMTGVINRLDERLTQQAAELAASVNKMRAVLVLEKEELDQFVNETHPQIKILAPHKVDETAYHAGHVAGNKLALGNKEIE